MSVQRQPSLTDQLRDLSRLAVTAGLYDAAQWLEDQLEPPRVLDAVVDVGCEGGERDKPIVLGEPAA